MQDSIAKQEADEQRPTITRHNDNKVPNNNEHRFKTHVIAYKASI